MSYDETLATFGLYMMLNQRQRNDKNNPHIAQLAVGLNRTASSVYMKLMNLRAHDPTNTHEGYQVWPIAGNSKYKSGKNIRSRAISCSFWL
mgnify:CR=1 FL=1